MAKKTMFISALLLAALITRAAGEGRAEEMQRALSDRMLRLHIVADSDGKKEQALKLRVKDTVLAYFEGALPKGLDAAGIKEWARAHTEELEAVSYETLRKEGERLPVKAAVEPCYFPEMLCGDILFPEGIYDALRIKIGRAQGKNWWCVLYPWLCPDRAGRLVVPDTEGRTKAAAIETHEADILSFKKFKIKWYYKIRRKK